MVLLITAACCLSEDWLGIKQSASTYMPHISSSVINAALSHLERVLYIRSQEQRRCRCEQTATEAIKHPKCFLANLPPGMAAACVSSLIWLKKTSSVKPIRALLSLPVAICSFEMLTLTPSLLFKTLLPVYFSTHCKLEWIYDSDSILAARLSENS